MDAQVSHGTHNSDVLIKKPGILARIDAPGFRSAMTKSCPESDDLTDFTIADYLSCPLVCLCQALILANQQNLTSFS